MPEIHYRSKRTLSETKYCYKCGDRIRLPDTAQYGDSLQCECGKNKLILTKPSPTIKGIWKSRLPLINICTECGDRVSLLSGIEYGDSATCGCGYCTLKCEPPSPVEHTLAVSKKITICRECGDRLQAKLGTIHCTCGHVTIHGREPLLIHKVINQDKLPTRNRIRGIHIGSDSDGDSIIRVNVMNTNSIYGKLEFIVLNLRKAFLWDEHPPHKKRKDSWRLRTVEGDAYYVEFDVDEHTIYFNDRELKISLKWYPDTDNFSITSLDYGFGYRCSSGYLGPFLRIIKEYWGNTELREPQEVKDLLNEDEWHDVWIKNLDHIDSVGLDFSFNYYMSKVDDYDIEHGAHWYGWHREHQTTVGHLQDQVYSDKCGELSQYFKWTHDTQANRELYTHILYHPDDLHTLLSAKRRRSGTTGPIGHMNARLETQHKLNVIRQAGRDKCVQCGGHIHSIAAYKDLPLQEVMEDEKQRFGVLCCGCYYRISNQLKEYKADVNVMKQNGEI